MEHRWNERKPVRLDVSLQSPLLGFISGRAENMSLGGIYVRLAPSLTLCRNAMVQVHFSDLGSDEPLPALVVRCDEKGAALMFTDFEEDTVARLHRLIEEGKNGGREREKGVGQVAHPAFGVLCANGH